MNLEFTPAQDAFRAQARAWIAANLPASLAARVRRGDALEKADHLLWQDRLRRRGWLAWGWPLEYGGTGWDPVERYLFEEECALAGAPRLVPFGLNMLGPVLIAFGSQAQKAHYLPRILDGSDWWCQGYSEPGAGSDLASLATRAERDGDHYVVTGHKTWTTLGHFANRMFCLVRTDPSAPKPQAGISFLLLDLEAPGVEVRPVITLDGGHEINEVLLEGVRVPVADRVGAEHRGWEIAKFLLGHERTGIAGLAYTKAILAQVEHAAQLAAAGGVALADDPLFAARLGRLRIDLRALEVFTLRVLGGAYPGAGAAASMLKIRGTELRQEAADLLRRATAALPVTPGEAPADLPDAERAANLYFNLRKLSIFGGTNEIQRNIVARALLGL